MLYIHPWVLLDIYCLPSWPWLIDLGLLTWLGYQEALSADAVKRTRSWCCRYCSHHIFTSTQDFVLFSSWWTVYSRHVTSRHLYTNLCPYASLWLCNSSPIYCPFGIYCWVHFTVIELLSWPLVICDHEVHSSALLCVLLCGPVLRDHSHGCLPAPCGLRSGSLLLYSLTTDELRWIRGVPRSWHHRHPHACRLLQYRHTEPAEEDWQGWQASKLLGGLPVFSGVRWFWEWAGWHRVHRGEGSTGCLVSHLGPVSI